MKQLWQNRKAFKWKVNHFSTVLPVEVNICQPCSVRWDVLLWAVFLFVVGNCMVYGAWLFLRTLGCLSYQRMKKLSEKYKCLLTSCQVNFMKFLSLNIIKHLIGHGRRWPAVVDHAWAGWGRTRDLKQSFWSSRILSFFKIKFNRIHPNQDMFVCVSFPRSVSS